MVPIQKEEFMRLVVYMRNNYGVNLENKQTLVEGRLFAVLKNRGIQSLSEYIDIVINDTSGEEAKTLVTRLTTNYTYFMREDQHYKFLVRTILPEMETKLRDRDLRTWSAGCSSGEEPFTTAMVIDDYFGMRKHDWDTKILATDISPQVLQMASEAIYPEDHLQSLPPGWKEKYFKSLGGGNYQVSEKIRQEVIFRQFNLMEKMLPFKKRFHVIFCRNVMIYFNKQTRDELCARFFSVLEPGGYFFIGLSETLSKDDSKFQFISPSIYKKP